MDIAVKSQLLERLCVDLRHFIRDDFLKVGLERVSDPVRESFIKAVYWESSPPDRTYWAESPPDLIPLRRAIILHAIAFDVYGARQLKGPRVLAAAEVLQYLCAWQESEILDKYIEIAEARGARDSAALAKYVTEGSVLQIFFEADAVWSCRERFRDALRRYLSYLKDECPGEASVYEELLGDPNDMDSSSTCDSNQLEEKSNSTDAGASEPMETLPEEECRRPIDYKILLAQSLCKDRYNAAQVWKTLLKMAGDEEETVVVGLVKGGGIKWKDYDGSYHYLTRKNLSDKLLREKKKAMKRAVAILGAP